MAINGMGNVTRRNFVATAAAVSMAAAGGATAAGAMESAKADAPTNAAAANDEADPSSYAPESTEAFDVVVVGAGAAGMSCATHCAENGLRVALLEKSTVLGGCSNSVFSAMVRTADDNIAAQVSDWVNDCHWRVDATAISSLLNNSATAFTWLEQSWGWAFVKDFNSMGVKNWKIDVPYKDRPALYQAMVDGSGIDVRLSMTAKALVQNDDGRVTGVIALDETGAARQFNAARAVVIATGGYAANEDMVFEAFGRRPVCGGLPQNVGEGLRMCWEAGGAKPLNYGMQMPHQTFTTATDKLTETFDDFPAKYPFLTTYMSGFMNVTKDGRRFRNEGILGSADAAANSSLFQGDFHWTIVSADQLALLEQGGIAALGATAKLTIPPKHAPEYDLETPWENATAVFDQMAQDGTGFKGETPEELAQAAGMDPEIFAKTLADYDACCAAGKDTLCGKDPAYLVPYGAGPYYAVYTYENNLTSWGGVSVDLGYGVLNANGARIPGLYAIGVEAGSNLYNDTYCGVGVGVCLVYTSGYMSAEDIIARG